MEMERLVLKNSGKNEIIFSNLCRDAIHGMKLGLIDEEITDIIKLVGDKNGQVKYNDFVKALNL